MQLAHVSVEKAKNDRKQDIEKRYKKVGHRKGRYNKGVDTGMRRYKKEIGIGGRRRIKGKQTKDTKVGKIN